jgi:hypothetical protein
VGLSSCYIILVTNAQRKGKAGTVPYCIQARRCRYRTVPTYKDTVGNFKRFTSQAFMKEGIPTSKIRLLPSIQLFKNKIPYYFFLGRLPVK